MTNRTNRTSGALALADRPGIGVDRPVLDLSMLAHLHADDRRRFEEYGCGPRVQVRTRAIHHTIEAHAAADPHAVAARHGDQSITYGELDRQSDRLADVLLSLGVTPGDNVGLFVRRSIPMVVGLLAALKVGAAYVPQHVGVAPATQLRHVMDAAGTRVVLTLADMRAEVPSVPGHVCIPVDEVMHQPIGTRSSERPGSVSAAVPPDPDRNCFVLFTSGTTGAPNGVQVTHRNVCNILLTSPGNLGMRPGWTVAQLLSISFDMAAWEILGCLANGATLLIRGSDLQETAERADVLIATPSVLAALDPARCGRAKVVAVAGEPCPVPLADAWSAFSAFHNSCGPTETTIVNTVQRYDSASTLTIGSPTPNNTVYVLDDKLRPCPIGEVGEMWAGGDCVTAGYLGDDGLTADRYRPDPFLGGGRMMFRTRDLGRWTTDGELEHHGRTDDQVKVRGFRVELDSVSAALESAESCRRAVTLRFDDRRLVAFLTPSTVDVEEALTALRDRLPYYCEPATALALDEFPVTARGKVDKGALLALAEHSLGDPGSGSLAEHSLGDPGSCSLAEHSLGDPGSCSLAEHSLGDPGSCSLAGHSLTDPGALAGPDHVSGAGQDRAAVADRAGGSFAGPADPSDPASAAGAAVTS